MRAGSESIRHRMLMRIRRTVGGLLVNPFLGRVAAAVLNDRIPHRGLRINTSDPLITAETKAALLFRAYESAEFRFMHRYLPVDADVVELGGSIGVMTCLIRRKIGSRQRLVTVEADHRLIELLQRNVVANGCHNNTTIEHAAIAVTDQDEVRFAVGASSLGGAVNADGVATIGVRGTSLSKLVTRQGLNRFNVVCDIEGAEWELWRLDREALQQADWIILETHDHPAYGAWQELVAEIEGAPGFRVVDRYSAVVVVKTVR